MTTIRFIVQSSTDTTADNAYELQQYLKTSWNIEAEAEAGESASNRDENATVRGENSTVDLLTIFLNLSTAYGALRFGIDFCSGFGETRQAFQDMLKHIKNNMTDPNLCVWLEIEDKGKTQKILVSTENLEKLANAIPVENKSSL